MRRIVFILVCSLFSLKAEAHAHLKQSMPAAGAALTEAPKQLDLYFSEGLEPAFSAVVVTDEHQNQVTAGPLRLVADDAKHAIVTFGPLPKGDYHVVWQATSIDTHRTQGSFDFSVGTDRPPAAGSATTEEMAPGMKM